MSTSSRLSLQRIGFRACVGAASGLVGYVAYMACAAFRLLFHHDLDALGRFHILGLFVGIVATASGVLCAGFAKPARPLPLVALVVPAAILYAVQDLPSSLWVARILRYVAFFAVVPITVVVGTMVAILLYRFMLENVE